MVAILKEGIILSTTHTEAQVKTPIISFLWRTVSAYGTREAGLSTHITVLKDVSLQCFPVPGSLVRSLLHNPILKKLCHRKEEYPCTTAF